MTYQAKYSVIEWSDLHGIATVGSKAQPDETYEFESKSLSAAKRIADDWAVDFKPYKWDNTIRTIPRKSYREDDYEIRLTVQRIS